MYKYRITKYNPLFRDDEGIYFKEDWTAISDLGKTFDGEKLTIDKYKVTEDGYIKAILLIMNYLNVPYLKISGVTRSFSFEKLQELIEDYRELYTNKMLDTYSKVNTFDRIDKKNVDVYCRLLLREDIGSKVYYSRKMKIFIGYDYLMSIHTSKPLDPLISLIEKIGLYVEDFSK